MILRDARPEDARRFEEVRIAGWHAAYGFLDPELLRAAVLDEQRVAWRRDRLLDPPPGDVTLVAEVDGEIAGTGWWTSEQDGEALLVNLYVDPARRGTGLGAAVLEAGFARLPQPEQVLWTFEQNAAARAFYERRGFVHDGGRRTLPMTGDPVEVRYRRARGRGAPAAGPGTPAPASPPSP